MHYNDDALENDQACLGPAYMHLKHSVGWIYAFIRTVFPKHTNIFCSELRGLNKQAVSSMYVHTYEYGILECI